VLIEILAGIFGKGNYRIRNVVIVVPFEHLSIQSRREISHTSVFMFPDNQFCTDISET
jgi:hypothetical protein